MMKKAIFATAVIVLAIAARGQEKDTKPHDNAITFGIGSGSSDISVRHIFRDRWTVLGTLGYGFPGVINVGASSSSAYELGIGLRRNFGSRPFRPFAHLEANRVWYDAGCAHISSSAYVGGGGVEYFVAPRVSIEGLAGVEHFANNQRCDANSYHYRSTSTFRSAVSVSFYF